MGLFIGCHPRLASLHGGVDEGGDGGDGCAGFLGATDWRLVLPAIGLHAFSAGSGVGGDWRLMVVVEGAVCGFGDSVGGPSNDDIFLVAFSCVVAWFFCGFLVSGGTNTLRCPVGLIPTTWLLGLDDILLPPRCCICQLRVPCEVRFPIREIGLVIQSHLSWWFASAPGCAFVRSDGVLADLVASGLCPSGEAMAGGHLQRPERLAVLRYADAIDMLLLVPIKNYVSLGRGSASSCRRLLRSPATSMTGQFLQGSGCNFCFFQRYLCKIWDVNYPENI